MEVAKLHEPAVSAWGGGAFPYGVGHKKLGMWLFIMSDSLTFAALLVGYSYVRVATDRWPTPFPFYPSIIYATVMTACLLSSSLTMVMAVSAAQRRDRPRVVRWIFATVAGGVAFLVLHLIEWEHLIHDGLTPRAVPQEWVGEGGNVQSLFGATFFTITGLHMFHVFTGVIYLMVVALRRRSTREDVEISGLYWHFVDLVWMFVFPLIYLLSIKVN
jgi:cytochrome c oxidase subunit III